MPSYRSKYTPEGAIRHPLYEVYRSMLSRCHCPKDASYRFYGARGIVVCLKWRMPKGLGFQFFLKDMGPRPTCEKSPGGMSVWWLERKNNNLGYYPQNTIWARPSQQSRNKRPRKKKQ